MIMPTRTSSNSSSIRRFLIRRQQQQHQCSIRWLAKSSASTTSPPSATHAFDRNIKTLQRENAARAHQRWNQPTTSSSFTSLEPTESSTAATANNNNTTVTYDYLREEIAHRLIERLDDIRRVEGFPLALDLGSGPGYIHKAICAGEALHGMEGGIGGIRKLVQLDSSHNMLHRDTEQESFPGSDLCQTYRLCADEEQPLPFPDETFDIVISSASMHWINELPSVLQEIRRVLKPDGCFVLAMIGGSTLCELRASLVLAEMEREGGVSPHVGPFCELTDVGNLIQRAGFALPTIDTDTIHVAFPTAMVLMEHLQRMGENNACIRKRTRTPLDTFLSAACIYDTLFSPTVQPPQSQDREIEASVQIIYAIGWKPHSSQPKPLKRGTATRKIGEIIEEEPPKDIN